MRKKAWGLVAYRAAVVAGFVWSLGGHPVSNTEESPRVLRTSPTCDDIVGYSGPNDCEIRLDAEGRIESVRLVRSGDTVEHADAVRSDPGFFARFAGRSVSDLVAIDGVSRATLTSLAIVESVAKRLSGRRPSLRFPGAIELEEIQRWMPAAHALAPSIGKAAISAMDVFDVGGDRIGHAVRTGPLTEAVVGYQGPTDTLLVFDAGSVLRGMVLRRSYDNEKYTDYVRQDAFFPEQFIGKSLRSLAMMDKRVNPAGALESDRHDWIDGVSGATMTSYAVAEGIVRTASLAVAPPAASARSSIRLRGRDAGTLVAVLLALGLTFGRLRGNRSLRIATRVGIIVYLGAISGDMLSQGLLVGWVENGLPWRTAPGLVVLAAAAFLVPVATGRQTYCHQLCAHGALQELARRTPWQRTLPPRASRVLRWLPGATLVVVVLAFAADFAAFPFGSIEPFGAWAWPLAGIGTCAVAVVGLVASGFYSMAYCRMGCPTGALLDFVRLRGAGDRFRRRDYVAGALCVCAFAIRSITA